MPMSDYTTKDSGARVAFASGMVRDTDAGKPRYDLIPLGPLRRLADLYARGAEKYAARNWEQANSEVELERFKASAFRHLMQMLNGDTDEDHGAAVVFNVFAAQWLEEKLARPLPITKPPPNMDRACETEAPASWRRLRKLRRPTRTALP